MRVLGGFFRQGLVVEFLCLFPIEAKVERGIPSEFETRLAERLAERLVAPLIGRLILGEIRGIRGIRSNLIDDDAVAHVLLVRQVEMFLRRRATQHRRAVPANRRCADRAGEVVVAWRDIGRQWAPTVYIRRDPDTGDVVLSRRLGDWQAFFALTEAARNSDDFLADRSHTPPPPSTTLDALFGDDKTP